jgi:hypothetical protein
LCKKQSSITNLQLYEHIHHVERFPFMFFAFYISINVLMDIHLWQNKHAISESDKKIASLKWLSRIFFSF